MSEKVEVQITQDEPEEIGLIIIDNRSHLASYFALKEWMNFKKIINSYDVETIKAAESEDIRIFVTVDYQYGAEVTLHLDDSNIMTMIGFTIADWEKFKKQVNTFKVEGEK